MKSMNHLLLKISRDFFWVMIFVFMISANAFSQEEITIASGEYAPWVGKNLKHNGFVNHVIEESFKGEGIIAQFKFFPWKRNYMMTKRGDYHAVSYYYRSDEREKDFYYSEPVSVEKLVFFHLKTFPMKDWETLDDLKEYRIGATLGYTYTKEFWEAAESKRLKVDATNSDAQNFKKMLKERIDIYPCGLVSGYNILKNELDPSLFQLITFHPKPLSVTTGHLLFPKSRNDSKKFLQLFNRGLSKLKEDGKYDQLMDDLLAGKYNQ